MALQDNVRFYAATDVGRVRTLNEQGIALPVKDYWEFVEKVTVNPRRDQNLDDYLKILHDHTEKIQSSPAAA